MKTTLVAIVVVAAACGGTTKPETTARSESDDTGRMAAMGQKHEAGGGHMGGGEKHEMGEMAMSPQISKFHDTLAPRWHAQPGPQRMADTCAAIPQFHADAEAIAVAEAPSGGDAAAWSSGGKQLIEAIAGLDATCKAKDATAFEPAFERVHGTFHRVMMAGGGHHEESSEPGKTEPGEHKH